MGNIASVRQRARSARLTFGPQARGKRPSEVRDVPIQARGRPESRNQAGSLAGYLAVLALFCFGFFGVLAFLSTLRSPRELE
jgi:hypothetical protein